jgi:hypothetical protein
MDNNWKRVNFWKKFLKTETLKYVSLRNYYGNVITYDKETCVNSWKYNISLWHATALVIQAVKRNNGREEKQIKEIHNIIKTLKYYDALIYMPVIKLKLDNPYINDIICPFYKDRIIRMEKHMYIKIICAYILLRILNSTITCKLIKILLCKRLDDIVKLDSLQLVMSVINDALTGSDTYTSDIIKFAVDEITHNIFGPIRIY